MVDDQEVAESLVFWVRGYRRRAGRPLGRVLWIGANAAEAVEVRTARAELLGTGTGGASQTYSVVHTPVVSGSLVVEVEEGGGWTPWTQVDDFAASGREDRVFTVDLEAGARALRRRDARAGAADRRAHSRHPLPLRRRRPRQRGGEDDHEDQRRRRGQGEQPAPRHRRGGRRGGEGRGGAHPRRAAAPRPRRDPRRLPRAGAVDAGRGRRARGGAAALRSADEAVAGGGDRHGRRLAARRTRSIRTRPSPTATCWRASAPGWTRGGW